MKGRESGMPEEDLWQAFFEPGEAISRLFEGRIADGPVVEFGCGYGTFTVHAALRTRGILTALDIEPEMIELTRQKAARLGLANVRAEVRDFVTDGTGLDGASQAHAMIYNLLHIEEPFRLLDEARRVVRPEGSLSVMHWRSDIDTPRGPPLEMRPSLEECRSWMIAAGFRSVRTIELGRAGPWHFGLVGQ